MQQTSASEKADIKANIAPPTTKNNKAKKINSRFGAIEVNPTSKINFPHGLLGIPAAISFCLTDMPNITTDQFQLLQCMEDEQLSFIVVPSQYDNQLIAKDDLDEACLLLNIKPENLVVLFIVTVHDNANIRRLSINAKAPVLVDAKNKIASQHVLQNDNYEIQHFIS